MKTFLALLGWALVISAVAFACHGSDIVNPPIGPNTAYPCGVWGVECRGGGCCPWAHICGDSKGYGRFNRCDDGYCCYDGDPFYGIPGDAGADASLGRPSSRVEQRRPR